MFALQGCAAAVACLNAVIHGTLALCIIFVTAVVRVGGPRLWQERVDELTIHVLRPPFVLVKRAERLDVVLVINPFYSLIHCCPDSKVAQVAGKGSVDCVLVVAFAHSRRDVPRLVRMPSVGSVAAARTLVVKLFDQAYVFRLMVKT